MARGKAYDQDTKAAVLTALMAGQAVNEVAKAYNVSPSAVRIWQGKSGGLAEINHKKGAEIGELVAGYLREVLTSLSVQQQHFRDRAWLAEQGAAEIAVLHGVSADKAFRLLEALQQHHDRHQGTGGPADVEG